MTNDTETLRAQFEKLLSDSGRACLCLYEGDGQYAYPHDFAWLCYQAGHAAAKAETVDVGEPVAWGWVDTMIGEGHRLMMVKINHHNDGVAVPLYTASQLAAAVAKEREPQMPEGWAFYSADFSSNAADAFKPGSVLLTRTGRNRAAWLAMSEEDQEVNALYASGRGFTLDEAVRAAIHCVDAIRAGAKESSDA